MTATTSTALPPGVYVPTKDEKSHQEAIPAPTPAPSWPQTPKMRLSVEDMAHPGAVRFFKHIQDINTFLESCVIAIFELLFSPNTAPTNVRSVTLILREMDGIAYTTGSRLDNDHKEIHFSLRHIAAIDVERIGDDIKGVLQHELVHCFQCSGHGCPGGLIEGMADYVRLRRGFAPPYWKRSSEGKWDSGYERTGYFLDWLDTTYPVDGNGGCVRRLNESMKDVYDEHIWTKLTGHSVDSLWGKYAKTMQG
ncbi:SubName: Full=Related to pathogenesis-related protein NtPRp27 {ECO:0000313/EMBL:CCA74993.1} [Serendipita indica DSM 11827]|uniref:Related to pathogenesis-related protein NtPRp27 n=1 Tax=Serendipita indica (strain DSM 11827) TaxID=1109443 RepID=G4TUK0_SERID|nr:SubName: Full=Related to pathogenesis-related protein NtPRp27 {ECO:0000313/EMBL:CCA74993.1} [Serendipita indica DSM 11827]CCA74993.1 related to pathogenesis-related protein NtPRp27 [Serendipita indica DSM 11827]